MKLPEALPDAPYVAVAFRLTHFHDEDPGEPQRLSFLFEIAGKLPGTEAEVVVPFAMSPEMVLELVEELVAQYRCVAHGPPEDEEPDEPEP